jgi:hypothetical protein
MDPTSVNLESLGVVGLCILAVISFARGWVWTKAQVADLRADRDMWRDTAQTLAPVVAQVLTEAETTNKLLRAMPGVSGVDR